MMKEQPFYFDSKSKRLFGILHVPETTTSNEAFVFCHALAEEKLWSHRVLVAFARRLAKKGYVVLRFDMSGEGDSEGEFEENRISTLLDDIEIAQKEIRERVPSVSQISLLGLRLGASLAFLVSQKCGPELKRLIMWEPILGGKAYANELLRANLANQMAVHGRVSVNRKQLVEQLETGNHVNIEGYNLSYELYQDLVELDLNSPKHELKIETLLVKTNREGRPLREDVMRFSTAHEMVNVEEVVEQPFWRETRFYFGKSEPFFNRTLAWLEN